MTKDLLLLPGPVPVAQPVLEAMARPMINHRGGQFAALLEALRRDLRPVFGTHGDVLVLGSSGTGGLEAAVASLFSPGDRLLSCPVGVFGKRLAEIARIYGCDVEVLETPLGAALNPQALRARLREDARGFRGILLTHNETSTGVQNDMAAIAEVTRAHGALTVVDSVSGLGASRFEMDEWGYDVVVTASQKAFAVPPGLAMAAVSERAWQAMASAKIACFYFDLRRARDFSEQGQTPWTPPVSLCYALDVALERYHAIGMEENFRRHERYAAAVRAGFEAIGMALFSRPDAHSVTVVAAAPPAGVDAATLLKTLRERYGVTLSGGQAELSGKIVRFGTMGDVTQSDLLGALACFESALADCGARLIPGSAVAAAQAITRGDGGSTARVPAGQTTG